MGLVFNKYFPWNVSNGDISKIDGWIKAFVNEFNSVYTQNEYDQRYRKMVLQRNGLLFELECISDLIIGMGNAHPMENGFTFDHTQGLPFIPGSTIKGIWKASQQLNENQQTSETKVEKRATQEKNKGEKSTTEKKVDDFIFLDAIPLSVKMKIDIMTPHYQPYYSSGDPPGDYYNPIPIHFVAVSKGSKFLWGLISRTKRSHEEPVRLIKDWLSTFGIGGKTAVGYGRIRMRQVGGMRT